MEFALFLNYAMNETGITNYRLAKKVGVSQTSVANWRNGDRFPRKGAKEKVLKLFGVTEDDIKGDGFPKICMNEEEQKEKPPGEGGLTELRKEAWDFIARMDEKTLRKFIKAGKAMLEE